MTNYHSDPPKWYASSAKSIKIWNWQIPAGNIRFDPATDCNRPTCTWVAHPLLGALWNCQNTGFICSGPRTFSKSLFRSNAHWISPTPDSRFAIMQSFFLACAWYITIHKLINAVFQKDFWRFDPDLTRALWRFIKDSFTYVAYSQNPMRTTFCTICASNQRLLVRTTWHKSKAAISKSVC